MNSQQKLELGVLVLNQSYEPLQICNVKRAFLLVFKEKASIIEYMKNYKLKTISREFPIPSIIRIEKYISIKRFYIKLSKENIFRRDQYVCQYCGSTQKPLTIDHIIPKVKGGLDSWPNLVTACQDCNNRKGDKDLIETSLKLLSKPNKPHRLHSLYAKIKNSPKEWKSYLHID